jgi:hypothetical protein
MPHVTSSLTKEVMTRDNSDGITHSIEALAIFRGIYKRVAVQLEVDPSYVSRVARGERHAPFITEALRKEIQRVLGKAGLHDGNGHNHNHNDNHNHSDGAMGAPLDGPSRDGHAASAQSLVAHTQNGHSPSLDGHHAPTRKKKSKTLAPRPAKPKRRS